MRGSSASLTEGLPPSLGECELHMGDESGTCQHYVAFGRTIASEIPLPMAPIVGVRPGTADVVFRYADPSYRRPEPSGPPEAVLACEHGTVYSARHGSSQGTLLVHRVLGTFLVSADHRKVTVYRATEELDERHIGLFLAGQVATYLVSQLGHAVLHASAVVTPAGATVFLGQHGQGKSTTASVFLRHGAQLLTDDALPFHLDADHVYGVPGPAIMKLSDVSAERALHIVDALPALAQDLPKKLLNLTGRYSMARHPEPVRAVYVLDRRDDTEGCPNVRITQVSASEALATLLNYTSKSMFIGSRDLPSLLRTYARVAQRVPVRKLSFASGFAALDDVRDAILADLSAL